MKQFKEPASEQFKLFPIEPEEIEHKPGQPESKPSLKPAGSKDITEVEPKESAYDEIIGSKSAELIGRGRKKHK